MALNLIRSLKTLAIIIFCCLSNISFCQYFVNNGSSIVSEKGSFIVANANYVNRNDGISDGKLDLNGTMIVRKNWVNIANNYAIINAGVSDTGNVILDGTTDQYIEGTSPTQFEDLTLVNSKKTLKVSDCKVNNKLYLNAILKLNSNRFVLENPNPTAIQYLSSYILSETDPDDGYGIIRWNIGDSINTYQVPFGSGNTSDNDLNLVFVKKTSGQPFDGFVSFSTYPTSCNNKPYPTGVTNLDREPEYIADRFWIIDPNYSLKPDIDIYFKYTQQDLNTNCNGYVIENELKAIRYNQYLNSWADMEASGTDLPEEKIVRVENVNSGDFFSPWCLVNEVIDWDFFVPNAFTPNADGKNDVFGPIGFNINKYTEFNLYIYNRWGQMVFHSESADNFWNGTSGSGAKACQQGIYSWLIFVKDKYGKQTHYKGIVTLLN